MFEPEMANKSKDGWHRLSQLKPAPFSTPKYTITRPPGVDCEAPPPRPGPGTWEWDGSLAYGWDLLGLSISCHLTVTHQDQGELHLRSLRPVPDPRGEPPHLSGRRVPLEQDLVSTNPSPMQRLNQHSRKA